MPNGRDGHEVKIGTRPFGDTDLHYGFCHYCGWITATPGQQVTIFSEVTKHKGACEEIHKSAAEDYHEFKKQIAATNDKKRREMTEKKP